MVELVPPTGLGHVFARADETHQALTVEIDGPGHSGLSPFRDFLAAGHRHHVATIHGPATVTLKSAGLVIATETFDANPPRRSGRGHRCRSYGSPW